MFDNTWQGTATLCCWLLTTTAKTSSGLDGRHAVFGKVIEGMEIVEAQGTSPLLEWFPRVITGGARGLKSGKNPGPRARTGPEAPLTP